jgi:hypothetical protein
MPSTFQSGRRDEAATQLTRERAPGQEQKAASARVLHNRTAARTTFATAGLVWKRLRQASSAWAGPGLDLLPN